MTALVWRDPCNHNACLQVAADGDLVAVRDSKQPDGPVPASCLFAGPTGPPPVPSKP